MIKLKRLSLLALSALMALSLGACQKTDSADEQKKFDEYVEKELQDSLKDDYLSVHMTFENPKKYGIDTSKMKASLGTRPTKSDSAKDLESVEKAEKKLNDFDRDALTEEQQDTYDIMQSLFDANKRSSDKKFDYMPTMFDEGNGLHVQFTYIFANFPIRNEEDIKNMILVVKDVRPYIKDALEYTKKQADKGLMMINLDSVIKYSEKIVKKGTDSSLLKDMVEAIDNTSITDNKKAEYKTQLKKAFKDSLVAGYKDITTTLTTLKNAKNNTLGLSNFKNGKDYYEVLIQNHIGEDISVKDVKKTLENLSDKYFNEFLNSVNKNEATYNLLVNDKVKTNYKDYKTMIDDQISQLKGRFPEVKDLNYKIQNIDPEVVSGLVAAYFIIPPIDNSQKMRIHVNTTKTDISSLSTYATVAHEGIPGHMYQNSYFREHNKNAFRYVQASNNAYSEGYAKYVEMLSYDSIKGVDSVAAQIAKNQEIYIYSVIVIGDIGIHYEGWTLDDFTKYVASKGLGSGKSEDMKEQYEQLQSNPAAFIPYFYGFSKFDTMRTETKKELGDKFNEKDFHEALLKSGSAPFSIVQKNVDAYIKKTK